MKKQHNKKNGSAAALPFYMRLVRGAVGKDFVIKHYRYGIIKTKYPDMSKIIASKAQRSCRDLFKEAVAFAKQVMKDPVQKKAWQQKIKHKHRVFNQVIKAYLQAIKKAKKQRVITGKYLLRQCFKESVSNKRNSALARDLTSENHAKRKGVINC
jgi:glutamate synthase domain-containing protein 2